MKNITKTYMTGYELGVIYGLMMSKTPIRKMQIRATNESAVKNLAKQFGYKLKFKKISKKWLSVKEVF